MGDKLAILAPAGRDAAVLHRLLKGAGVASEPVDGVEAMLAAIGRGEMGAAIVTEEALTPPAAQALEAWLAAQPPWSDLPIILLTTRQATAGVQSELAGRLGNVTILERPLHPVTLAFSARAALRARVRQRRAEEYVEELSRERLALAASEARYRTLFESIDEGFCIIEFIDGPHGPMSDYVHVAANPAYRRHSGIPHVVGRTVRELLGAEADGWIEMFLGVLTGEPIRFERELVATGRHLELAAFRIDLDGRRQVAIIFQDVTARRQAEIALRELNETLEQRIADALADRRLLADIIEHTSLFVQIIGLDWRLMGINKAAADEFERIFGVRPKAGDDPRELLADKPEHRAAVEALWNRALAGEEFTEIAEFGDPAHDRRAYEMRYYVLRDAEGTRIGAYQFVSDVTERMAEQRKLVELQKTDAIGQLTGGVAHDFNNLLSAILSNLDLARKSVHDPRAARLIEGAIKGAERGASLTKRLLAFARRQDLQAQTVDVGKLVAGMQELLSRTLGAGVALVDAVPASLPPITVDPNQLELALLNLAVNARDAMPGGGRLEIGASLASAPGPDAPPGLAPGGYVRITVTDEGGGMDAATIAKATEPFFTTKGVGKGTGLGLSMVQGLAHQSNGALRIASEPGRGTQVQLWLPRALPAAAGQTVDAASPAPAPAVEPEGRLKVLVVDDDALVGMGTAAMLEDLGHETLEAFSGRAALDLLAQHPDIDAIVTDQSMPGMTGLQLAAAVLAERPGLPIILASGYADLPDGKTTDLPKLAKPFRQDELARILRQVVSQRASVAA